MRLPEGVIGILQNVGNLYRSPRMTDSPGQDLGHGRLSLLGPLQRDLGVSHWRSARRLELFEPVDVDDEDGRASHLDLDRIRNEKIPGFDQRWHRIHELTAGPAVLLYQPEHFLDAVIVDAGHQGDVLVLKKPAGAGELRDRDPTVVEGIHGRGCVLAVDYSDQQFHAERRWTGRTPACASASLT